MQSLKCPSCGAVLELPDNLRIAHCVYCGTKVILEQNGTAEELQSLNRALELCKVALDAKNYEEALRYANTILEIDPSNVEGWINKATASFFLTTAACNRYNEALEYLRKAEDIAPTDERIIFTRGRLTDHQAQWYAYLGEEEVKHGAEIFKIYDNGYYGDIASLTTRLAFGPQEAKEKSQEHFVEAMKYFLLAASYAPDDDFILIRIENLAKNVNWVTWSNAVRKRIQTLHARNAKEEAELRLSDLRKELQQAEQNLASLRKEKGLFIGMKIGDAQDKVRKLRAEIAKYEQTASYQIPV